MRTRQRYLVPLLAAAATAAGIAAAPPAGADCIEGGGVTICTQGDARMSNRTALPVSEPYVPYPCELDWLCDQGRSMALID